MKLNPNYVAAAIALEELICEILENPSLSIDLKKLSKIHSECINENVIFSHEKAKKMGLITPIDSQKNLDFGNEINEKALIVNQHDALQYTQQALFRNLKKISKEKMNRYREEVAVQRDRTNKINLI